MERRASGCLVKSGYGLQADSTTARGGGGGGRGREVVEVEVEVVERSRRCLSGSLQTDVSDDTGADRDATVCIYC